MQAVTVEHLGDAGTLRELPMPEPKPNELLVRVTAAGVNPVDWKIRDAGSKPLPFILGQDFAGVVSATGSAVTGYAEGERIFGCARKHGAYAQFIIVPHDSAEEPVAHIPDGVGDADAASLPTAGLTALASLDAMNVGKGTNLVVLGATGGVGGFAVQIAKSRGARVIGTAHSKHAGDARALGVDDVIAYDSQPVVESIGKILPEGADAILDLVDDAESTAAMRKVMRPGAAIVSTIHGLDVDAFTREGFKPTNIMLIQTPQYSHAGLRELARMVEDGTLRVTIAAERDLHDAVQALEASKTGGITGKLVITVETGRI